MCCSLSEHGICTSHRLANLHPETGTETFANPPAGYGIPMSNPGPTLVPTHKRHSLPAITVVSFDDGLLRLRADAPAHGALAVIKSSDPLSLVGTTNCSATLRLGWDGTLGYSHYGLTLDIPAAGEAVVQLHIHQPPTAPLKTTQAEIDAYIHSLHQRPSRFPDDANGFVAWQAASRKKLAAILMNGGPPARVPLEPETTATTDHPAFTLHAFRYRSQPDRTNTALLSLPKSPAKSGTKAPLLLALHGHESTWGEADPAAFTMGHNDDFCAYFAERGWAVIHPATMDHTLQHDGWTLQGEWTWDALCALDLAAARPEVDPSRIAVVGLSTGAHLAMNMLALDERIKAGVVGCVLSTWHHEATRLRVPPHCDCGILSQLAHHFEECDWAALAAPKPVQFQHGRKDQCFFPGADDAGLVLKWNMGVLPKAEYDAMFGEVERAWKLAGNPAATETRYHEGNHQVNNEAAFEWLSRMLD